MEIALKGEEWRQPGLVTLAAKLATSAREHKPIQVRVPSSYKPKTGANPWSEVGSAGLQAMRSQAPPESGDAAHLSEERSSMGAAAAMKAPPPNAAPLVPGSAHGVELASLSSAKQMPARTASVDVAADRPKPLSRPRSSITRRRSSEMLEEGRQFHSGAGREPPPSSRGPGRLKELDQHTSTQLRRGQTTVRAPSWSEEHVLTHWLMIPQRAG
jgi:hypothetical protein